MVHFILHCYCGWWTWDYSSWEGSIRSPPLDKTLNSVITVSRRKIKLARKIKGKILLKKGLERKNTVHPQINQMLIVITIHLEDWDIDDGPSSEFSKEEMSQIEHTSLRFSTQVFSDIICHKLTSLVSL